MLPELARRLIDAYTRPGDWILDPMSGIGTTGVEAIHRGRNYVGLELEDRFVAWQGENLEQARREGAPGSFVLYQADARQLDEALHPSRAPARSAPNYVDVVLTSPPYGDRLKQDRSGGSRLLGELIRHGRMKPGVIPGIYGHGPSNLGNLGDAAYLREMGHVYHGCYQVLKPGGLLVIVIRPGRHRHQLRPLHHETARLCREIGFEFLDEVIAVLARVVAVPGQPVELYNHALFWKRLGTIHLREAGYPVSMEQTEYVLVFRKPDALPVRPPRRHDKSGLSTALTGAQPRRS